MPGPDMREYMKGLIDQTLRTPVEEAPNWIRSVGSSSVMVATEGNSEGAAVSISLVQDAVNEIYSGKVHLFNPRRRSAFLGAVLRTMDEVEVLVDPRRARLRAQSPYGRAGRLVLEALDALGGDGTRQEITAWARGQGGNARPLADDDLASALAELTEAGTIERPERGEYRLPTPARVSDPAAPAAKNPDWQFDELVLALDVYLRFRPTQPREGHPEVAALSDRLRRLPLHPHDRRAENFRSQNSVHRKLEDFKTPDPTQPGKGMRGGEVVRLVWERFAEDPGAHAAAVARITAGADEPPMLPPNNDEAHAVEGRILVREHRYRDGSTHRHQRPVFDAPPSTRLGRRLS